MSGRPAISYEVFPPRTPKGAESLARAMNHLSTAQPTMVSVTYGAGGADKDKSFAAVELATQHAGCPVAAHLTCVGVPRREVDEVVDRYLGLGVRHVVALRGDPSEGIDAPYRPHPEGFESTAALVAAIRQRAEVAGVDVTVSVSAYPEVHPQSPDLDHDLDVLSAKVAAGANRAMTQMFFDNEAMVRYLAALRSRDIAIPVIPGIMPVHDLERISAFAQRCGASVPQQMVEHFTQADDRHEAAVSWATMQIQQLIEVGLNEFHLYTLNQADLVLAIVDRLGETS
ncbi:MAG: methylenetetrahydrofolate reductase [Actinomycetota bacterium]|nr:methylenetetrahydrofolate reductase [Actinomycetota bacterium]